MLLDEFSFIHFIVDHFPLYENSIISLSIQMHVDHWVFPALGYITKTAMNFDYFCASLGCHLFGINTYKCDVFHFI